MQIGPKLFDLWEYEISQVWRDSDTMKKLTQMGRRTIWEFDILHQISDFSANPLSRLITICQCSERRWNSPEDTQGWIFLLPPQSSMSLNKSKASSTKVKTCRRLKGTGNNLFESYRTWWWLQDGHASWLVETIKHVITPIKCNQNFLLCGHRIVQMN